MTFDHKKYNSILLDILKEFIDICERNNLQYYASGGTAIGAVRHNGMIPWDDDIDVYMPRHDYERFLQLKESLSSTEYEILDLKDHGYYVPYAKFCNKNTSIWEETKFPFIIGVFIDIFPLDQTFEDRKKTLRWKKAYTFFWYSYLNSIRRHTFKEFTHLLKEKRFRHALHLLADISIFRPTAFIWKPLFIWFDKRTQGIEGPEYLFYQCSYDVEKEIFPKEWFEPYTKMTFENVEIRLAANWDKYLTQLFGNYMQLPPEEKRVSRHFHTYVNLDKRVSINEAKLEL